jgi:hypothetical protein
MKNETKYIELDDGNHYVYITDLDVSSMLISIGYEVASLDRLKEGKVTFIFRKENGLDDAVEDFLSGKLSVNALAFSNARKNLKARIYTNKSIDY